MPKARSSTKTPEITLPFETSVGYQIRMAHRATQRALQDRIAPHGVTLGMWYFLRALWHEDGQTQRELSDRLGLMEPTTLKAIATMERAGLVRRERSLEDKRKLHVHLTGKGRDMARLLLPLAVEVVEEATLGFSADDRARLLDLLKAVQANLAGKA